MLYAAWIIFRNEFRLVARDRAALFMLALAPLVIITVAGLSLGTIYGARAGSEPYYVVIIDDDHGWISQTIVGALRNDKSVSIITAADPNTARTIVSQQDRTPVFITIPSEATRSFEAGRDVNLVANVDPVKRLEAGAIELDLDHLLRNITADAHKQVSDRIKVETSKLRDQLAQATENIKTEPTVSSRVATRIPKFPDFSDPLVVSENNNEFRPDIFVLPGNLGLDERSIAGGQLELNTFDQYVPGFGITFLLVDMLWGVGVGLIDERDWGTLARLHVSGAPASSMMVGKLMSRFVIGVLQMVLLFAAGWVLFGIALGRSSWALLLPAAAISFSAAAFSLVIACIANTRDAVLPIGAMAALAMSAIGGCWWPLDFEPYWMRDIALAMPTTWTMEAFNNLMIRRLEPASALWPSGLTIALGILLLAGGLLGSSRIYRYTG